jgi:glycogen phosphorylase
MASIGPYIQRTRIAYFSMEVAIRAEMHTYSGGLGVLAGDLALSAADLELPIVLVSLVSRAGYVRQEFDESGMQLDMADPWEPAEWSSPLGAMVSIELEGRQVWVRPWLHELSWAVGRRIPIILLDTCVEQNDPRDRQITDRLYGGDAKDRLRQEAVLGIGGGRILDALGFKIETYHLNEGHAALLPVSLLLSHKRDPVDASLNGSAYDIDAVRSRCVFTTHTPVDAGHDRFSYDDVRHVLGDFIEIPELQRLGGRDVLNMTQLALNLSNFVNGVAKRHAETARAMFPGYPIRAITNGVHVGRWTHPAFARLYQDLVPHWSHEPEALARAASLPDDAVWLAHRAAKADLIETIRGRTGSALDPDLPIFGFARRMTGYKRPDLLFSDLDRLRELARARPFQIVLSGKAHAKDEGGKALIKQILRHSEDLKGQVNVIFVPNYDLDLAKALDEGGAQWRAEPERAGRLVDRGLRGRNYRLGNRSAGGWQSRAPCRRALL